MVNIIVLVVLVFVNAFFSGSELALISLNKNKLKIEMDEGNKKSKMLYRLVSVPTKFLSMIQIGVTLSGFLNSALASDVFADYLVDFMLSLNIAVNISTLRTISMVVITLTLTLVTLIFGELVPKRIAMNNPEKFARMVCLPVYYLYIVLSPLVTALSFVTNLVLRLIGIDPSSNDERVTEEEIRMMVSTSSSEGEIEDQEKQMINNIFEFNDTLVQDVMTHRVDIKALEVNSTFDEVTEFFNEARFTRIPIYEKTLDNVIGILHTKDVLTQMTRMKDEKDFVLKDILRDVYFVPEYKRIDKLFYELRTMKQYIAIVLDEHGGTAGIVSIEDLVEEIVGEVFDEYDEAPVGYRMLTKNSYVIEGSIELNDVNLLLKQNFPSDKFQTLNDYILASLGYVPDDDDNESIVLEGWKFTVLKISDNFIERLRADKVEPSEI